MTFVTTQEALDRYPDLDSHGRESALAKEYGTIFLMQIGGALSNGKPHDGRAPDYDDWSLNGDIIFYDEVLGESIEISSMGIRVDAKSMAEQLKIAGCESRLQNQFHKDVIEGNLPLTIGGGIGQSRLCMLILQKAHIGEVQSSLWPDDMHENATKQASTCCKIKNPDFIRCIWNSEHTIVANCVNQTKANTSNFADGFQASATLAQLSFSCCVTTTVIRKRW